MPGRTHGESQTRLYRIWKDMRRRCRNSNRTDYYLYGGRGIRVCDEWKDYIAFRNWSLNNGYQEGLTIDRIDFNGNYEPTNCRWILPEQQNANTRQNVFVEINGVTKTLTEWAKESKLPLSTLFTRYRDGLRGVDLIGPKKVSFTGHHHTEDARQRIGEKLKGDKNHNFGRVFSEETRKKMSEAKKGKKSPFKKQVTKEQVDLILKMYKEKPKYLPIAQALKCNRRAIKRVIQEAGDANVQSSD